MPRNNAEICARYYQRHREKRKEYQKLKARAQRIALSPPNTCKVCGARGKICFDHNHDTNKFRGWLCASCNNALGFAGDNPVLLDKLTEYLRRTGCYVSRPVFS